MSNGERLFPNAELVMHENEPRTGSTTARMAKADERSQRNSISRPAANRSSPTRIAPGCSRQGEVFPGVTAVPSHGPYAGPHRLSDCVRQRAVDDLGRHRARAGGADRASRSRDGLRYRPCRGGGARKRMFDRVATDRVLVAGMHLHFPSFSQLVRQGGAYALIPEAWVHTLDGV